MKTQKTEKTNNFQIKNEIKLIKPDKRSEVDRKKIDGKKEKEQLKSEKDLKKDDKKIDKQ